MKKGREEKGRRKTALEDRRRKYKKRWWRRKGGTEQNGVGQGRPGVGAVFVSFCCCNKSP
jgi:hypothetical protein